MISNKSNSSSSFGRTVLPVNSNPNFFISFWEGILSWFAIALISSNSNSSNAPFISLEDDSYAYPKRSKCGKIPNPISIPSIPSLL